MSEMIERVAKELRDSMPGLVSPEAWPWKTLARAAIEAMREPTKAMTRAQYYADIGEKGSQLSAEDQAGIWQAMIDAALK